MAGSVVNAAGGVTTRNAGGAADAEDPRPRTAADAGAAVKRAADVADAAGGETAGTGQTASPA